MSIKIVDARGMSAWIDVLVAKHKIIGVQAQGERFAFAPLARAADLRLDYDVSILPPKAFLQPPCERLLRFDSRGGFASVLEGDPFVLFGVHPYDVAAIAQMDEVFTKDHYDVHYMARRNAATIVMCDIQTASPNVFAGCMGTATVDEGYDVRLTRIGDFYMVEAGSKKGGFLVKDLSGAENADATSLARREQIWDDNRKLLRKHELRVPLRELPALLGRSYDHPVWEEKAQKCFSCGSCVLVCPTCYCFDVRDDLDWNLKSGTRSRTWDGCMLQDFALVAGGHNFRKQRVDRYRHRYYRKGKYIPDRIGKVGCVGCGRCITACVSKIANPTEVFNRLVEGR